MKPFVHFQKNPSWTELKFGVVVNISRGQYVDSYPITKQWSYEVSIVFAFLKYRFSTGVFF
jgi:hypothetical protein